MISSHILLFIVLVLSFYEQEIKKALYVGDAIFLNIYYVFLNAREFETTVNDI